MEEIEMLSIDATDPHQEYHQELLKILKDATKDNSIVYEFKFDNQYCYCKVTKYEIDGSHQLLDKKTFSKPKEVLIDIIEPFIKSFANQNDIMINNITPNKGNNSNLKIISEFNDMCDIINLNETDIIKMSELVEQEKKNQQNRPTDLNKNEKGLGNVIAFMISLIIVGIIILGMLVPDFIS